MRQTPSPLLASENALVTVDTEEDTLLKWLGVGDTIRKYRKSLTFAERLHLGRLCHCKIENTALMEKRDYHYFEKYLDHKPFHTVDDIPVYYREGMKTREMFWAEIRRTTPGPDSLTRDFDDLVLQEELRQCIDAGPSMEWQSKWNAEPLEEFESQTQDKESILENVQQLSRLGGARDDVRYYHRLLLTWLDHKWSVAKLNDGNKPIGNLKPVSVTVTICVHRTNCSCLVDVGVGLVARMRVHHPAQRSIRHGSADSLL